MPFTRMLALSPLLAAIWLAPSPAAACKCPGRTTADAIRAVQAVFEGHVLALQEQDDQVTARLAVVRQWKGVEREEVVLTTPSGLGDCGVHLLRDESYLVFAVLGDDGETLTTTTCHGTKPMAMAVGDLREMSMGVTPFEPREKKREEEKEPPARGGCASCAVGQPNAGANPALWLLMAATLGIWRTRRR